MEKVSGIIPASTRQVGHRERWKTKTCGEATPGHESHSPGDFEPRAIVAPEGGASVRESSIAKGAKLNMMA